MLDEPIVQKLCIQSLRRRVGSMDHIHALLVAEDDLNETSDSVVAKTDLTPTTASSPEPEPSSLAHLAHHGVSVGFPN